jgi:hypothetical protein
VGVLGEVGATEFIGEPAPVNVAFSEDTEDGRTAVGANTR